MTTDDLARLRAGLDRDETIARAAVVFIDTNGEDDEDPGDRWISSGDHVSTAIGSYHIASTDSVMHSHGHDFARHVALHDPSRVLRQVSAMRKILEEHQRDSHGDCTTCRDYDYHRTYGPVQYPCPTVQALAGIYPEDTTETGDTR